MKLYINRFYSYNYYLHYTQGHRQITKLIESHTTGSILEIEIKSRLYIQMCGGAYKQSNKEIIERWNEKYRKFFHIDFDCIQ